jgi:thioredoxin 1
MGWDGVVEVTDEDFDESVLRADLPVLVFFWVEGSVPCRALRTTLESLSGDMPDKLDVVKVNIDDNPRVAQRFEVLSTPVMILFDRGEMRTRITGVRPKSALLDDLAPYVRLR